MEVTLTKLMSWRRDAAMAIYVLVTITSYHCQFFSREASFRQWCYFVKCTQWMSPYVCDYTHNKHWIRSRPVQSICPSDNQGRLVDSYTAESSQAQVSGYQNLILISAGNHKQVTEAFVLSHLSGVDRTWTVGRIGEFTINHELVTFCHIHLRAMCIIWPQ